MNANTLRKGRLPGGFTGEKNTEKAWASKCDKTMRGESRVPRETRGPPDRCTPTFISCSVPDGSPGTRMERNHQLYGTDRFVRGGTFFQKKPATLFVHGLSPEISGLIKRQKIG